MCYRISNVGVVHSLVQVKIAVSLISVGGKISKSQQTFLNFFKNANCSDPKQQICNNQECGHQGGQGHKLIANAELLIVNLIVQLIFDATAVYCF